jgi:hypothetical protein
MTYEYLKDENVLHIVLSDESNDYNPEELALRRPVHVLIDLSYLSQISYAKAILIRSLIKELHSKGMETYCIVTRPFALTIFRDFLRVWVGISTAAFFSNHVAALRYLVDSARVRQKRNFS